MTVYTCSFSLIRRSSGQSVVNAAAYRAGEALFDERLGVKFDHSSKKDVYFSKILLPSNAPRWMKAREALWNSVEKHEVRADAQLAREVLLTLPRERDIHWGCTAVEDFAKVHFVGSGMVCDLAVHRPLASDQKAQPHAHLLLSLRRVTPSGWDEKKEREWNRKQMLMNIRKAWADYLNWLLKPWKVRDRIDHRRLDVRLAEQVAVAEDLKQPWYVRLDAIDLAVELDRPPQPKMGLKRVQERASTRRKEELEELRRSYKAECEWRRVRRKAWAVAVRKRLMTELALFLKRAIVQGEKLKHQTEIAKRREQSRMGWLRHIRTLGLPKTVPGTKPPEPGRTAISETRRSVPNSTFDARF